MRTNFQLTSFRIQSHRFRVTISLIIIGSFALLSNSTRSNPANGLECSIYDTSKYAALERDILAEINLARTEPKKYAVFVEEQKGYYNGKSVKRPGRDETVSQEGVAAVDEAIAFLRSANPVARIEPSVGLRAVAEVHAKDMATNGITGHAGSDKSTPTTRADRLGIWKGGIGETIIYTIETAREIVIGMIVDDGVANRGHRRNVFNPDFHVAGIAVVDSEKHEPKGVVVFAGSYFEKKKPDAPKPAGKPLAPTTNPSPKPTPKTKSNVPPKPQFR